VAQKEKKEGEIHEREVRGPPVGEGGGAIIKEEKKKTFTPGRTAGGVRN